MMLDGGTPLVPPEFFLLTFFFCGFIMLQDTNFLSAVAGGVSYGEKSKDLPTWVLTGRFCPAGIISYLSDCVPIVLKRLLIRT
jgi:hypothetical protein